MTLLTWGTKLLLMNLWKQIRRATPQSWPFANSAVSPKGLTTSAHGKVGIIYAFQYGDMVKPHENGKAYFKVGKTVNLEHRTRSYRTLHPDGTVYYRVEIPNKPVCAKPAVHHAERMLHDMLKLGGYHVKQEIFLIEPEKLKKCMDLITKVVAEVCSM